MDSCLHPYFRLFDRGYSDSVAGSQCQIRQIDFALGVRQLSSRPIHILNQFFADDMDDALSGSQQVFGRILDFSVIP